VAIAWLLQRPGVIVIPKAASTGHLREDAQAASIELDADDLALISRHWPPPARKHRLAMV
jgi:diketogulonate reductase-like aldo/keto reductase